MVKNELKRKAQALNSEQSEDEYETSELEHSEGKSFMTGHM